MSIKAYSVIYVFTIVLYKDQMFLILNQHFLNNIDYMLKIIHTLHKDVIT